ncbi:hypothetical protein D3C72_1317650 [compost metagenome]
MYDAGGRKLRRVSGGTIDSLEYDNGIQYSGGSIDFLQMEEGMAYRNGTSPYIYRYNLIDHLGNVRVTVNEDGSVHQEDSYYAFGMRMSLANNSILSPQNRYLYNGKEEQDITGWYDYGARFYDPTLGRWNVVDPLAEDYRRWSPYNYAVNNPIRFIDPDGMGVDDIHLKFQNSEAEKAYLETVNKSLGGTYTASIVKIKDGSGYNSKVVLTKGDDSKATTEQKAFGELYSSVVNDKTVVKQTVVSNDNGVDVGSYESNKLDIGDIKQFDKAGKGGSSTAGALIHETIEQFEKAKIGLGPGQPGMISDFEIGHQKGIDAENRVNGNRRIINPFDESQSDMFLERDGSRTQQTVTGTKSGGIIVNKVRIPKKSKK